MKYVENKKFMTFDNWLAQKARYLAEDLSELAVKSIKAAIKEKNIIASGNLLGSWSYTIAKKGLYVFLVKVASSANYWRAVEEGTEGNPKFTPIPNLIQWIKEKGGKGGFPTPETESDIERLAYAIAITHKKQGIKGRHYLELGINKFNSRKNIIMFNWTRKYASGR